MVIDPRQSGSRKRLPAWILAAWAATVWTVAATPGAAGETCSIAAVVTAAEGGAPVAGAVATVVPGGRTATSDADGGLRLAGLAPGRYEVLVVAEGFSVAGEGVDCPAGERLELRVPLRPAFGEEVVVTGTRTARKLVEVPVHIQVVERESIEASAARTLADAVELTSGVRVESNCQNCNVSQLRMLGLGGAYSQILIDGQPTVSSLALVYGIEQFPARLIDSLEVVKGGGSAVYGAGAVGGVINLIPHQPTHSHVAIEARYLDTGGEPGSSLSAVADWSSEDRRRSLSAFGQVDEIEPVDVDGDGFSEVTRRRLGSYGARFEQYLRDDSIRLAAEANFTDADRRGGDLVRFDRPPEETALTEAIATERLGASVSWLHQRSPHFDYRLTASFADTHRDSYYGAGFDPDAYGTTDNPLWVADAQLNHHREKGTVTWGVQLTRDVIDDVQPGYDRVISERYEDVGLFLQDDRQLGSRASLLYGVRVDRHSAIDDPILSPRAALLYSPRPDLTLRASVATGFRPPVVFDEDLHVELLGGGAARVVRNAPELEEERSTAYLLSAEWRPSFGRKGSASVVLDLFDTELDALFDTREADDPATPELEFVRVNFGRARVAGVELSASVRWGSRFAFDFGLVQQSSRFAEPEPDFGSRDFFRTPDRHGSLTVRWRLPREVDLFFGARYTGSMKAPHYAGFIAEDRLETTPPFLTLDLNLARAFQLGGHREVTVKVGAKNLTDEYQEDLDRGPDRDASYVYGPRFPRSFFLGFEVDL